MDKFLELYPEYKDREATIRAIRNKVIFKKIKPLDEQLSIFKTAMIRKMLTDEFYKNPKLLASYREIIKNEKSEVEKAVFQLLSSKSAVFKDIFLKFLFYKEFPEKFDFFLSSDQEPYTIIADLLFKKVYMKMAVQNELQTALSQFSLKDAIFYLLALSDDLDLNFRKELLMKIKSEIEYETCTFSPTKEACHDNKSSSSLHSAPKSIDSKSLPSSLKSVSNVSCHYKNSQSLNNEKEKESNDILLWCLGVRSLPSEEYYRIISNELLFASYIEKLIIFRSISEITDMNKLSIIMLKESLANPLSTVKMYILYLKVIELLNLDYSFKLQILYTWLRFFIVENKIDLFNGLMSNLEKSKKLSEEYEVYHKIKKLLNKEISQEQFIAEAALLEDTNSVGLISLKEVILSVLKFYKNTI